MDAEVEELIEIYMKIWGLEFKSQVTVGYSHYEGWYVGHNGSTTLSWVNLQEQYKRHMTLAQLKEAIK